MAAQQHRISHPTSTRGPAPSARALPAEKSRRGAASEPERATARGSTLAEADQQVLSAFREYLMVPGEMLCFTSIDLAKKREALRRLTDAGMLVAEKFPGAYSLTAAGFAMMGQKE